MHRRAPTGFPASVADDDIIMASRMRRSLPPELAVVGLTYERLKRAIHRERSLPAAEKSRSAGKLRAGRHRALRREPTAEGGSLPARGISRGHLRDDFLVI